MSTSPMNKETEITDNGLPKVLSQIITDNVYFLKQRHRVPQTSIANAMHITQSTLNLKLGGKFDGTPTISHIYPHSSMSPLHTS